MLNDDKAERPIIEDAQRQQKAAANKLAFLRLDPVLRMLLASIEQYRECTSSSSSSQDEERILGLMRTQVKIMHALQTTMKSLAETYGSESLLPLTEYILLPLRALIQSPRWNISTASISPVRQSALWKTVQTAADTLEKVVALLDGLSIKQTVACLTACTIAVPMEEVLPRHQQEGAIDHGDDCLQAILSCIAALFQCTARQSEEFSEAIDGALVAPIAHACITILSPSTDVSRSKTSPELRLQALNTLDAAMKAVPNVQLWQSIFPGCFAGLCGLILAELRLAPAQASPKVSSEACHVLSRLLCLTLCIYSPREETSKDALQKLKQLSIDNRHRKEGAEDEFLKEARQRLPAPLMLLFNFLPTASSPRLRLAATDLVHAVLVGTRFVWETLIVPRTAMECCIMLSRDDNERVVSSARRSMEAFWQSSGKCGVDNMVFPRIVELVQELPVLAKSGKETELRAKLNLISGYLGLEDQLRASIVAVSYEIRVHLAAILDVDFDTIQYTPRIMTTDDLWNVPEHCRFRYLRVDTQTTARHMIRLLGQCVGQKRVSALVDACIADVLEASLAVTHDPVGSRQVDWLHQWIGYVILANELLAGAFGETLTDHNSGLEQDHENHCTSRENRRRARRLHSLAGAILPVVTSDPLWNFPTILDEASQVSSSENVAKELQDRRVDRSMGPSVSASASALKGNAALVCSLIGIVTSIVSLMGSELESFLPMILYPLCEKASALNHSQVQHSASSSLRQVAVACGLHSTRALIRRNFDYLCGAMLAKLRLPGGGQGGDPSGFPQTMASILLIVLRTAEATEGFSDLPIERSIEDKSCIPYVIVVVKTLVSAFDRSLIDMTRNEQLQASAAMGLTQVFDASLSFIASTFGISLRNGMKREAKGSDASEEWVRLLEPFRRTGDYEHSGISAVKEGFEKIRQETRDEMIETRSCPLIDITNDELDFTNIVLTRCSFFLSSPSLHVQVASIISMQHAFVLLGYVSTYTAPPEGDETNGPRDAVLRHISSSWPSISSRLRNVSSEVTRSSNVKIVSIHCLHTSREERRRDVSSEMSFLANLFDLIACMCEVSGSFMIGRVQNDVWPVVVKVLDMYLRDKQGSQKLLQSSTDVPSDSLWRPKLVTAREKLLHSVLDFLSRVFGAQQCGHGISDLIPAAGTMLFPFLETDGEVRSRTMKALKAMLIVDCDALWRPLLRLSHRRIDPSPLAPQGLVVGSEEEAEPITPLELAAKDLVNFVETLPEQSIGLS